MQMQNPPRRLDGTVKELLQNYIAGVWDGVYFMDDNR